MYIGYRTAEGKKFKNLKKNTDFNAVSIRLIFDYNLPKDFIELVQKKSTIKCKKLIIAEKNYNSEKIAHCYLNCILHDTEIKIKLNTDFKSQIIDLPPKWLAFICKKMINATYEYSYVSEISACVNIYSFTTYLADYYIPPVAVDYEKLYTDIRTYSPVKFTQDYIPIYTANDVKYLREAADQLNIFAFHFLLIDAGKYIEKFSELYEFGMKRYGIENINVTFHGESHMIKLRWLAFPAKRAELMQFVISSYYSAALDLPINHTISESYQKYNTVQKYLFEHKRFVKFIYLESLLIKSDDFDVHSTGVCKLIAEWKKKLDTLYQLINKDNLLLKSIISKKKFKPGREIIEIITGPKLLIDFDANVERIKKLLN
jgi:hypothetical protein